MDRTKLGFPLDLDPIVKITVRPLARETFNSVKSTVELLSEYTDFKAPSIPDKIIFLLCLCERQKPTMAGRMENFSAEQQALVLSVIDDCQSRITELSNEASNASTNDEKLELQADLNQFKPLSHITMRDIFPRDPSAKCIVDLLDLDPEMQIYENLRTQDPKTSLTVLCTGIKAYTETAFPGKKDKLLYQLRLLYRRLEHEVQGDISTPIQAQQSKNTLKSLLEQTQVLKDCVFPTEISESINKYLCVSEIHVKITESLKDVERYLEICKFKTSISPTLHGYFKNGVKSYIYYKNSHRPERTHIDEFLRKMPAETTLEGLASEFPALFDEVKKDFDTYIESLGTALRNFIRYCYKPSSSSKDVPTLEKLRSQIYLDVKAIDFSKYRKDFGFPLELDVLNTSLGDSPNLDDSLIGLKAKTVLLNASIYDSHEALEYFKDLLDSEKARSDPLIHPPFAPILLGVIVGTYQSHTFQSSSRAYL